jgi:hypothetical protein
VLHAASHGGAILHRELSRLPEALVQEPCVQHAITVIRAYRCVYHRSSCTQAACAPHATFYTAAASQQVLQRTPSDSTLAA